MKKSILPLALALVLVCAPAALADHIPPMGPTPPSSNAQLTPGENASETAHAAVSTAVQVLLDLIALGVGGR